MITKQLAPRALARHGLVILVVAGLVALGQWQFARLDQVRTINAQAAARMTTPAVDIDELLAEVSPEATLPAEWPALLEDQQVRALLEHRRVKVTGQYRIEQEVLQRNREHQGRSGFHLLTPLALDQPGDDERLTLLVRRGWVPPEHAEPPVIAAMPQADHVTITGVLELPVEQPSFGPQDAPDGRLARVFHTDTHRLDSQIDGHLLPLVLRLEYPDGAAQRPDDRDPLALPVALGLPRLDEANHFSYAVQWHIFAVLAAVTYAAWIIAQRKRPRSQPAPLQASDQRRRPVSTSAAPLAKD